MTTTPSVDPDRLAHHIASMYRDVANETGHDLHFHTGRALAEALGYPSDLLDLLPAQAVSSFAGVGYHLGLARWSPASACSTSAVARAWTSSPPRWRRVQPDLSSAWTSRPSSSARRSDCAARIT